MELVENQASPSQPGLPGGWEMSFPSWQNTFGNRQKTFDDRQTTFGSRNGTCVGRNITFVSRQKTFVSCNGRRGGFIRSCVGPSRARDGSIGTRGTPNDTPGEPNFMYSDANAIIDGSTRTLVDRLVSWGFWNLTSPDWNPTLSCCQKSFSTCQKSRYDCQKCFAD